MSQAIKISPRIVYVNEKNALVFEMAVISQFYYVEQEASTTEMPNAFLH